MVDGISAFCLTAWSRRHLSPSASVIRAPATVQQAGPLNPSLIAPPESPRARPPKLATESTLEPAWVGLGHLARQLASRTQKLFLLRSLARVLSWGRKHGERACYLVSPATRTHAPAANQGEPPPPTAQIAVPPMAAPDQLSVGLACWDTA